MLEAGAMDPEARTATKAEFPSKFPSGMGRKSENPAASAADNDRPRFKGHRTSRTTGSMDRRFPSESPSKFTSGMGRRSKNPAASAVGNERPLERREPSKATS